MAATNVNACVGGVQTSSSAAERWSSLHDERWRPNELAAPIDRVRFAAVCTAWRAVASMHLARGGFPWLMLDPSGSHETNYAYCPEEGMVLPRLSLRSEASRWCFVGSHDGGWVASSEMIFNLFSGAKVSLLTEDLVNPRQCIRDQLVLRKIVFSKQPTLSGCILAAITNKHEFAFYEVGCPESGWKMYGSLAQDGLMDITFCNGELYGITWSEQLNKYEFGVNNNGGTVLKKTHRFCMLKNYYWGYSSKKFTYILELHGRLVMVTSNFTVLELVNTNTGKYECVKMYSLGDYALFLGPTCSKAVPVPTGERGDLQKNHIYISYHRCLRRNDDIPNNAKVFLKTLNDDGYRVFYKRDRSVNGIRSTRYYVMGGFHPPMWLLPP